MGRTSLCHLRFSFCRLQFSLQFLNLVSNLLVVLVQGTYVFFRLVSLLVEIDGGHIALLNLLLKRSNLLLEFNFLLDLTLLDILDL